MRETLGKSAVAVYSWGLADADAGVKEGVLGIRNKEGKNGNINRREKMRERCRKEIEYCQQTIQLEKMGERMGRGGNEERGKKKRK